MARHVVVVGAGSISATWFKALADQKVRVDAVVDMDLKRAQGRISEFGMSAEASTDMVEMLGKHQPDFILDLTIPESHCDVACTAMEHGCHVLGEKPMAATLADARRMVGTSEKTGMMYMVSQSRRWDANHELVHRMITSGKIGPLTTINCDFYIGAHFGGFRDEMPSPLILDMAIHQFDLARYMGQCDAVDVFTHEFNPAGSWYKGNAAATCIFQMSSGAVFTFRGSWCAEGCNTSWNGSWRFVGQKGTIIYENDRPPYGQVASGRKGFIRPQRDIKAPPARMKRSAMQGSLAEMLEFLRSGKAPQTECHDNIKSLAMVFAAIDSARKRKVVPVRPLW